MTLSTSLGWRHSGTRQFAPSDCLPSVSRDQASDEAGITPSTLPVQECLGDDCRQVHCYFRIHISSQDDHSDCREVSDLSVHKDTSALQ